MKEEIKEIKKLHLEKGDILFIDFDETKMGMERANECADEIKRILSDVDVKVMFTIGGLIKDIRVVNKKELT